MFWPVPEKKRLHFACVMERTDGRSRLNTVHQGQTVKKPSASDGCGCAYLHMPKCRSKPFGNSIGVHADELIPLPPLA
jgi:hypothetical protein